jgi:hypothetical protein
LFLKGDASQRAAGFIPAGSAVSAAAVETGSDALPEIPSSQRQVAESNAEATQRDPRG